MKLLERDEWQPELPEHPASVGTRADDTIRFFDVQHADALTVDGEPLDTQQNATVVDWANALYDLNVNGQRNLDVKGNVLVAVDGTVLVARARDEEPGAGEPGTFLVFVEATPTGELTKEQGAAVAELEALLSWKLGRPLFHKGIILTPAQHAAPGKDATPEQKGEEPKPTVQVKVDDDTTVTRELKDGDTVGDVADSVAAEVGVEAAEGYVAVVTLATARGKKIDRATPAKPGNALLSVEFEEASS